MDDVQLIITVHQGLSWDAMLKLRKIRLELIPHLDMYVFFEKGAKGGISYISNRYSKAKNNYLEYHDPKQEPKHIFYTQTRITYMIMQYLNLFQQMDSTGQILKNLN